MRSARLIFGWLFLFYAVGTGGHLYSPDAVLRGRVTESLVLRGSLAIDATGLPPHFAAPGRGGQVFPKYDGGLSLVAVPFFLIGDALARWGPADTGPLFAGPLFLWYRPENAQDAWRFFGLGLTNCAIAAATCALLFLLLERLGYSRRAALGATAALAFASPLWVYSKDMFAEPLAGLGLLLFAFGMERAAQDGRLRDALLAGAGIGLSCCTKSAHLVLVPLCAAVFWWRTREAEGARWMRLMAAASAGLASGLAVIAAWNFVRFEDITNSGYGAELQAWTTPPLTGLAGLLVSPGRGLLWFWPPLLLALAMAPRAWRRHRHRQQTIFAWGCLAILLALYCRWGGWEGGWAWGPRFLVPALPALALTIAPFFEPPPAMSPARRSRSTRWLGWALLLLGCIVTLIGTLVPTTDFHQALRRAFGAGYLDVARWSWNAFPPIAYLLFSPKNYSFFRSCLAHPEGWWLAALFGAGWAALLPLGRATLRSAFEWPAMSRQTQTICATLIAAVAVLAAVISRYGLLRS